MGTVDRAIEQWMDKHIGDLLEIARTLVRIPSENHPPSGDECDAQRFVQERLQELGARVDWFTPDDVPGLRDHPAFSPLTNGQLRIFTNRPDVVGVFGGTGGGRSALFSTHIDTVPAGTLPWITGTPFGGEIVDGKLYGRGSYDTKCALASHLMAVRCLQDLGVERRGNVIIESVVDEEYSGSHGVLASRLRGYNADIAFNSEPTHMDVCPTHRGGQDAYLHFRGDAGRAYGGEHPADPVVALARTVMAISKFNADRQRSPAVPPLYRDNPEITFQLTQIGGGGTAFEDSMGVPGEAWLHFWAEVYEGTTVESFDAALLGSIAQELDADPDTAGRYPQLIPTSRFLPGSSMRLDHPALSVLRESFESLGTRQYRQRGAPFACDAYIFNLYSPTPALILGPGGAAAHGPDEYVLVADLIDLAKICARFIARWCA